MSKSRGGSFDDSELSSSNSSSSSSSQVEKMLDLTLQLAEQEPNNNYKIEILFQKKSELAAKILEEDDMFLKITQNGGIGAEGEKTNQKLTRDNLDRAMKKLDDSILTTIAKIDPDELPAVEKFIEEEISQKKKLTEKRSVLDEAKAAEYTVFSETDIKKKMDDLFPFEKTDARKSQDGDDLLEYKTKKHVEKCIAKLSTQVNAEIEAHQYLESVISDRQKELTKDSKPIIDKTLENLTRDKGYTPEDAKILKQKASIAVGNALSELKKQGRDISGLSDEARGIFSQNLANAIAEGFPSKDDVIQAKITTAQQEARQVIAERNARKGLVGRIRNRESELSKTYEEKHNSLSPQAVRDECAAFLGSARDIKDLEFIKIDLAKDIDATKLTPDRLLLRKPDNKGVIRTNSLGKIFDESNIDAKRESLEKEKQRLGISDLSIQSYKIEELEKPKPTPIIIEEIKHPQQIAQRVINLEPTKPSAQMSLEKSKRIVRNDLNNLVQASRRNKSPELTEKIEEKRELLKNLEKITDPEKYFTPELASRIERRLPVSLVLPSVLEKKSPENTKDKTKPLGDSLRQSYRSFRASTPGITRKEQEKFKKERDLESKFEDKNIHVYVEIKPKGNKEGDKDVTRITGEDGLFANMKEAKEALKVFKEINPDVSAVVREHVKGNEITGYSVRTAKNEKEENKWKGNREVRNPDGQLKRQLEQADSFHLPKDVMPKVDDKIADKAYNTRQTLKKANIESSVKIEEKEQNKEVVRVKGKDDKLMSKEDAKAALKELKKLDPNVGLREHVNKDSKVTGYSVRTAKDAEEGKRWTEKEEQRKSDSKNDPHQR